MKTTKRFDNAVRKLYTAFHENNLSAGLCNKCAVGNMVNGKTDWMGYVDGFKNTMHNQQKAYEQVKSTGYTINEIVDVERIFESTYDKFYYQGIETKTESQYKALCAVVEYLCELDNIPNVLDYTKLFETEEGKPKYELA